jgi:hypothetical protein
MDSGNKFSNANESISLEAIEYACDLTLLGIRNIEDRLYSYGRLPLSSYWLAKFLDEKTLLSTLVQKDGLSYKLLNSEWLEKAAPIQNNSWRFFYKRSFQSTPSVELPFKLYINLHPDSLISEFSTIIDQLTSHNIPVFKFSKDVYNIVRPDKFIVYIRDFQTLKDLGESLSRSLKSAHVQLLPFTAALDDTGCISTGFDPPSDMAKLCKATSWRSFVTTIITQSLLEGFHKNIKKDKLLKYSLKTVKLIGINPYKWFPENVI